MDDEGYGGIPRWQDVDDTTLINHLREALTLREQPPEPVVRLAKASFGLRDLDAELARLTADSLDEAAGPRVRSVAAPRLLTFEAAEVTVEVEVVPTGSGWRLIGQAGPAGSVTRVELRRPADAAEPTGAPRPTVPVDQLGRFALDAADPGPAGLRCHRTGGSPVDTSWFLLG